MEKKPTNELDEELKKMHPDDLDAYLAGNRKYLAEGRRAFYYYFTDVLDDKNIKLKDVYSFAGVTESYGGQIIRMEKHTKERDLIIRLCLAGHFSWDEMNRALKLYGMTELYAKDPRDACIAVAVNNRTFDPYKIDEILISHGFSKLTSDK